MAQVFVAPSAAAVGIAASPADGDEAGGQDGAFGPKFSLTCVEEAADEGGVFGYFHEFLGE